MMRAHSTLIPLGGVLALGLSLAGCGMEPDPNLDVGDESPMIERQQGEIVATGCSAIVTDPNYDAHTGTLIGYGTGATEIVVNQVKWLIRNPSATDCNYVELVFELRDPYYNVVRKSGVLATSLKAGYHRYVYWSPNYDTRTLGPRPQYSQRQDIDALLLRNGVQIRIENLESYFLATGQY